MQSDVEEVVVEEPWGGWHVNWSAIWIGALTSIATALVLSLIATAAGASFEKSISSWKTVSFVAVTVAICTAYFSMAAGGWAAAKVTGVRHAEPAILHAVVAWLVAVPALLLLLAAGTASAFGGWYGGFITSPLAAPAVTSPEIVRNTALASLTTLLVGLVGAVIGGWMASGEPMSLTHHRTRKAVYTRPKGGTYQ
jgi:hypothetical protein